MMLDDRRRECDAAFFASYEQDARDAEGRLQRPTTSARTQQLFYAVGAAWVSQLATRAQMRGWENTTAMSTGSGLHCRPCDSFTGCGMGHYMHRTLSDLAHMSPLIKQLHEMDRTGYLEMSVLGWYDCDNVSLFNWLDEHAGHELEVYDEYGGVEPLEPLTGG